MPVVVLRGRWSTVRRPQGKSPQFSDLYRDVQDGKVNATVNCPPLAKLPRKYEERRRLQVDDATTYNDMYTVMKDHGVSVTISRITAATGSTCWERYLPFALVIGFWVFMLRQMQSSSNKALSFGKSRAPLHSSQQKKVTFKDVAGVEEAKEELQEIIEFLREPQKFQKLGGRIPKGVC